MRGKRCYRYGIISVFLLLFFAFAFLACQQDEPPEGVLSKREMVHVLAEIYITEEKINRAAVRRDSAEKVFELLRSKVFEKTGTTDSVFKRSWNYYLDRPHEMEEIYSALVDTLSLREQRVPYRPDKE